MNINSSPLRILALALPLALAPGFWKSASAEIVFAQDFENGLGPNESTFGNFSINDTLASLNNGTLMMGHASAYGGLGGAATPLPTYSYYEVVLDLRGFESAELRFDFSGAIEKDFDGFNVLATTDRAFSPPDGLITPTAGSEFQYDADPLQQHGASSPELGAIAWSSPADPAVVVKDLAAVFDLSAFDAQKVRVRFQFGTDAFEGGEGANFDNIVVEGTALPDTDGDGMPDSFEDSIPGLDKEADDSGLDLDSDGIDNITEFENCTDPGNPDSDDDGLTDDVETNTGVFVSASDTGSDPTFGDTDGDQLSDGDEVGIYGSDPNKTDTDGDGYPDGVEVDLGFNPTDPNSRPAVPLPIGYWSFDDEADPGADSSPNGNHGTVISDPTREPGASGVEGDFALSFDGIDDAITTEASLLSGLAEFTMAGWVKFDTSQTNRTGLFGQNDCIEFGMINSTTMQHWSAGGGAFNIPFGPTAEWTYVVVTNNPTERVAYFDGEEAMRGSASTAPSSSFTFNMGGGGIYDATGNFFEGELDEVAVWDVVLTEEQIQDLASGEITPLGPRQSPRVTGFEVKNVDGQLELSWDSEAGNLYNLRSETNPASDPVSWGIFDGNQDIAATPPRNTLTVPYPADPFRLFVVESFPTPPTQVFSDDFEGGQGSWTTGSIVAATATEWELGTPDPDVVAGPDAAHSGANCFGTDLDAQYVEDTGIFLRSPAIDLSSVLDATLKYWSFTDIEPNFDSGSVYLLDAADDSEIAVLEDIIEGTTTEWEEVSINLPAEAIGKMVKIEFRFTSDDFGNQAGFYVDDVTVEGQAP